MTQTPEVLVLIRPNLHCLQLVVASLDLCSIAGQLPAAPQDQVPFHLAEDRRGVALLALGAHGLAACRTLFLAASVAILQVSAASHFDPLKDHWQQVDLFPAFVDISDRTAVHTAGALHEPLLAAAGIWDRDLDRTETDRTGLRSANPRAAAPGGVLGTDHTCSAETSYPSHSRFAARTVVPDIRHRSFARSPGYSPDHSRTRSAGHSLDRRNCVSVPGAWVGRTSSGVVHRVLTDRMP